MNVNSSLIFKSQKQYNSELYQQMNGLDKLCLYIHGTLLSNNKERVDNTHNNMINLNNYGE